MEDASPHHEPVASTSAAPFLPCASAASSTSTSSKPPGDLLEGMEEEVPECTICYESSPVTWGILDCCDHHFCYQCIRAWQNVNEQGEWNDGSRREEPQAELSLEDAQAKNACPVCRRKIYLVMPTPKLFETKEEKEEAFEVYEDGLSETPCRALMASDPDFPYCPRGRECPYSHTHHGTGYHYTFSHTHTEHLLAVQRLSHERQAQHFMLALLSSGGLLASSILPTLPLLPNGVRNVVEELAGLVRDGEMGRFRSRIGELGNEGEWRRSVTERMWVGEGEEPTGEDDEGEGWYDEVDEEDEGEGEDVSERGWETDEDVDEADEEGLPDLEPLRAYSLGRAVGARDRERERRRAMAEDEEGDSDGLPPLEAIDGSDLEEESSEDQEEMDDDDLPPLEEIDVDDLPPAPRSAPSPSIPSEFSASSDSDSDSGSASSVYEDADSDLDPLPPRPSSSSAPTVSPAPSIPASVSFASTFSSAFPSPRPLTPAAAPSVFPPSIATSGPSPAAAAQKAVQHLRSSLSRPSHSASSATSAQQPAEEPSEEEEESEEEPDSDDSIAVEHAALARQYARAERLFELAQEETNPIRRAALEREAVRLYGANDWVGDGGNGMEEWREGESDEDEGEEGSSEGEEEEEGEEEGSSNEEDDLDEEEDRRDGSVSYHSDSSSTDDDTHERPPTLSASASINASHSAPPLSASFDDPPPPAPIRSMSRWSSSSTTPTATTSTRARPPVDPAQREMEKRRRRAAQAAERRRAEEKWEEMD